MTTPNDPKQAQQPLTPESLANQLFDAAIMQNITDPREAARQVIIFLTSALVYAVSSSAGDEAARKALLDQVGKTIASAPPLPGAGQPAQPPQPPQPPPAKP